MNTDTKEICVEITNFDPKNKFSKKLEKLCITVFTDV